MDPASVRGGGASTTRAVAPARQASGASRTGSRQSASSSSTQSSIHQSVSSGTGRSVGRAAFARFSGRFRANFSARAAGAVGGAGRRRSGSARRLGTRERRPEPSTRGRPGSAEGARRAARCQPGSGRRWPRPNDGLGGRGAEAGRTPRARAALAGGGARGSGAAVEVAGGRARVPSVAPPPPSPFAAVVDGTTSVGVREMKIYRRPRPQRRGGCSALTSGG